MWRSTFHAKHSTRRATPAKVHWFDWARDHLSDIGRWHLLKLPPGYLCNKSIAVSWTLQCLENLPVSAASVNEDSYSMYVGPVLLVPYPRVHLRHALVGHWYMMAASSMVWVPRNKSRSVKYRRLVLIGQCHRRHAWSCLWTLPTTLGRNYIFELRLLVSYWCWKRGVSRGFTE